MINTLKGGKKPGFDQKERKSKIHSYLPTF